jgi:hypothetical protein
MQFASAVGVSALRDRRTLFIDPILTDLIGAPQAEIVRKS